MSHILQKLIGHNLAGVLGVIQTLIPLLRELGCVIIRIGDVFLAEADLEPLIVRWVNRMRQIESQFEWFKNLFIKKSTAGSRSA